ncbi:MAG: hypothetical protein PHE27_03985, partial [Alphaproteobacteria bacterium]|nr:hypothetical protein [Alphaproteobacteria bacterium]
MDCSEDTRIQLSKELLKRKQATIREMIVATYGEWPLRGLDVVSDEHLDKNVRIWGYWRSLYHYLSISPRRSAFRVAAKHLTDWHGCASSAHRAVWIKSWVSGKKRFSSLAHERRHIQQYDLNPGTETLADAVMNLLIYPEDKNPYTEANGYTRNSVEDVRYYQKGEEVQAFLEEILVAGYPHWPRLPLKKGELWAVLTNA